jgi:fatty-acyl-CoA synthase
MNTQHDTALPSISKGIALSEEPALGALTLPGFLREVTERHADREALVLRMPDGVVRWSYSDLWERATEVARALIACGVGKDSRVGILMTNRPEWVASFFGVGLAGGVAVALSTFSTLPELEYQLQATAVSIVLFERRVLRKDFAALLCELEPAILEAVPGRLMSERFPFLRRLVVVGNDPGCKGIEGWADFLAHGKEIPQALVDAAASSVNPSDLAGLFLSSGTTNRPKGVLNSHRGIAMQCWRWPRIFALKGDVRSWSANAFTWSGNFTILGATLATGGSLVLQQVFDPEEAIELFRRERVTWPYAWPHQWARLEAASNWEAADFSSLHYVDPSRPVVRHPSFRSRGWADPWATYGSTETFTLSTAYPCDAPAELQAGNSGEPLPGNTIKIVDPLSNAVVPRGERGEIAVKGATLMLGYMGVPLSETLDEEAFFHTGDGGYIDPEGRLHFEGRLTDIIKTGGANVSPLEVDHALSSCPGVKAAKTVGIPHDTLGEMVVTCIVPQEGAVLGEDSVRDFLKQQLASYKIPRRVLFVSEADLSLTGASSKIKTEKLRELVVARMAQAT